MAYLINKTTAHKQDITRLLIATAFLGAGLAGYAALEGRGVWGIPVISRYSGLVGLAGQAMLGVAITALWPEFTLILLGGGPTQRYLLLPLIGMPTGGMRFVMQATLVWVVATVILVRRGMFRFPRLTIDWPLAFMGVMGVWIVSYTVMGYTWLGKSEILDKYLILSLFSMGALWYLIISQSADVVRTGKRLLWAILVVNAGGLVVNMLVTTGSLAPMFDPYSSYWMRTQGETRLTLAGFSEIGFAAEVLAPAAIAGFALLFSPTVRGAFKIALMGLITWLAVLIMATGTRQAALGGILALIVIVFLETRKQARRSAFAILLIVAVAFPVASNLTPRFGAFGTPQFVRLISQVEDWSSDSRVIALQLDVNAFLQNPLLGNGVGISSVNSGSILGSHNTFTSIAAEVGIIPLLVALGFLVAIFRSIWQSAQLRGLSADERVVLHGLVGLFIVDLATAMASGRMEGGYPFFGTGTALYFFARSLGQVQPTKSRRATSASS